MEGISYAGQGIVKANSIGTINIESVADIPSGYRVLSPVTLSTGNQNVCITGFVFANSDRSKIAIYCKNTTSQDITCNAYGTYIALQQIS